MKLHLLANRSNFGLHGIEFLLIDQAYDKVSYATRIEFEEKEEGMYVDPTFRLGDIEAQALMDSLWDAGFRPTNLKSSDGELSATKLHLQDERELVNRLLDNILKK